MLTPDVSRTKQPRRKEIALPHHGFNAAVALKRYGVALLYVGTLRSQSRERSSTKPSVL